ncbi:MAG: TatD family hydrolase [Bacteroidales bacterium]|nr:TatD family hydrolase [Bacteroidales bacterium]
MNWIDTHTHTYDTSFGQDPETLVRNALDSGVDVLIQGGVDMDTVGPIRRLCEAHPGVVYATIGLHPTEVKEDYETQLKGLYEELSSANAASAAQGGFRYVAVGEIGLDLHEDKTYFEQQKDAFRKQLHWAKALNLPVVLHVRNAFEEAWHILKQEQDGSLRGVFHCYGGNLEQAPRVVDLGFSFGIGGVLTFKNSILPDVVRSVPRERILLETDAPYLAPVPHRGTPNESAYIPLIGQKLADCLEMQIAEVARFTTANARNLFKI